MGFSLISKGGILLQLDFIKLVAVLGLPLLSTILGLFVGNIILFDSLLISAACGYFCYSALAIHPAYCLVASAVLCHVLFLIQHTQIGFWAIAILLSYCWGFAFALFAYHISGNSELWFYSVLISGFIIMLLLHIKANKNNLK